MKIARVSNFDDESYSETFVKLEGKEIFRPDIAERLCDICKSITNPAGEHWYKVVNDDYQLKEFQP